MTGTSYRTTVTIPASPAAVFDAINDIRSWWGHDVEGSTRTVGDQFTYWGKQLHRSRIEVVELVPGERVVWRVLENWMSFVQDQTEWPGTTIVFDLVEIDGGTEVRFAHEGLLSDHECFEVCSPAWTFFVTESLPQLVTTGTGMPLEKERETIA